MKYLIVFSFWVGNIYADMSGPSKEIKDFLMEYNLKYRNELFVTSTSHNYEIELCFNQLKFTPCEVKWCIIRSRRSLSKKWIRLAEEGAKNKCELHGIEDDFVDNLNTAKKKREKCLRYIQAGSKKVANFKECTGVLD